MRRPRTRLFLITTFCTLFLFLFYGKDMVQAHAYSASYSTLTLAKKETLFTYALDELSVIELTHGDLNNNGMLDQEEFDAVKDQLIGILKENISIKINGEAKEWDRIGSIVLDRKGDATKIKLNVTFSPVKASQSISLIDDLYLGDASTNYVNLLTIHYGDQNSTAALSGRNRVWTLLLTESDYAAVTEYALQKQNEATTQTEESKEKYADEQVHATPGWFSFFRLGIDHILSGYDHLLFLLSLLIARQAVKEYAMAITSFTIAHSLTLTLTVLGWIDLPANIVEPAIALSICYVALENIIRKEVSYRWAVTFGFGLIHGMGFADILKEMDIPKSELAVDLASFNIGIEAVQLAIVLLLLPLLSLLHRWKYSRKAVIAGSTATFILGGYWFIERMI